MKNFSKLIAVFALFLVLLMAACHKHNHADEVTINIQSPTEGAVLATADSLHMHIEFTSSDMIHNVLVKVTQLNTNETPFIFDEHVHAEESYTFHHIHAPLATGSYQLQATVTGHSSQDPVFTETVNFSVAP
ncbi:MAG TPA: hypothetical protein PK239_13070 [Chitinophagales bacterium]|nr:hypothetical protein [Chitinophagales bacterium]HRK28203.1 hypothetical protein [Chitinophagales bacterium]